MESLGAALRRRPRDAGAMIIAIDGPAASGKGTLAKRIAAHFGLPYLDTGLLYRAVARDVQRRGGALDDRRGRRWPRRAASTPPRWTIPACAAPGPARPPPSWPASRRCGPPCSSSSVPLPAQPGGAVLDGRDIGTVVCPDADVKIYVTATPRGARQAALSGDDRAEARPSPTRPCWPISAAATSAMPAGMRRPCGRPPTPSCWIPAIWI